MVAETNAWVRDQHAEIANDAPEERSVRVEKVSRASRLDRLIHERILLGIVSVLSVSASLSHNELMQWLKTTDGNLSVHARKLEDAEYIQCVKSFDARLPRTVYRLTACGRKALENYLD